MMKLFCNLLTTIFCCSFLLSQLPESKEATLLEQISSSEWLIEATGKYNSTEKRDRKARKDIENNGVVNATDDAKKAAIYFILYAGTDPFISSSQERQNMTQHESFYFDIANIGKYISWEDNALQKKVKLNDGRGIKIVKRFKINISLLKQDLENHNIIEASEDMRLLLGNPFIMVIPEVEKGENPIDMLKSNKQLRHAAAVVEGYLTAKQYDVVVPSAMAELEDLNNAQFSLADQEEDLAYELALSLGSDIYITYSGAVESAGYGTEKYSVMVRAYETTTARLLGTETGYSQARKGEIMLSIEEAVNGAIGNVLSRINNYWETDLRNGVQYKLIVRISTDFDEDEAESISFAFMDAVEDVSKKSKENIVTSQTLDYLIWCDPSEYDKSSRVYRYVKKKFNNFIDDEGVSASLRKVNVNRKMILLKVNAE